MTATATNNRVCWADLLRILAILAVMGQHLTLNAFWQNSPPDTFFWQTLNTLGALTKWCVPVFVMLSGMFFLDPAKTVSAKKLWGKNILRLVTAFLFWSAAYILFTYRDALTHLNGGWIEKMLKEWVIGHYHMWFVYAILGLYILIPILRKLAASLTRRELEYFLLLWLIFSAVLPFLGYLSGTGLLRTVVNKLDVTFPVGFVGYFMLGYYLNTYPLSKRIRFVLYAAGIVLGLGGMLFFSNLFSFYPNDLLDVIHRNLSPMVVLMSIAVFVFFRYEISRLHFPEWLRRCLPELSGCCFGAFLVHDFFISFAHMAGLNTNTFPAVFSVLIMLVWVACGSFLFVWLFRRLPFARKYLS